MNPVLLEHAREVLFDPIGMTTAEWWSDAVGQTLTYCCLDAPSREFARFGLLYARNGRWGDRQVVSEDYVRASLEDTVTFGAEGPQRHPYGFQWWLSPGVPPQGGWSDIEFMETILASIID